MTAPMSPDRFHLCLLLSRSLCRLEPLEVLDRALQGGVDLVQLREKELATAPFLDWALEVAPHCREAGVPLIINDQVDVALACDADGVHVGQDDLPPREVRQLLGKNKLIGLSTHSLEQVEEAQDSGWADYLGFGPAFPTATKGYSAGLGPDAVLSASLFCRLPLLAIGGITTVNRELLGSRVGVAVSSAICGAERPEEVAARLRLCRVS